MASLVNGMQQVLGVVVSQLHTCLYLLFCFSIFCPLCGRDPVGHQGFCSCSQAPEALLLLSSLPVSQAGVEAGLDMEYEYRCHSCEQDV